MAKQTIIHLLDDLDSTLEADETVHFGLDGREYEIDLTSEHIDDLHDALAPYIEAGRRTGGGHKPAKPEPGRDKISREEAVAIREWVRTNDGHIGDRGRIPKKFVDAYRADPKDMSIFHKDDDGQPEQPEPVGAGAGGDPFSTF